MAMAGVFPGHRSRLVSKRPNLPLLNALSGSQESKIFSRYGGSESCRSCHEDEYDLWKNSNHALAERTITPQQDRSAFDPPRFFGHGSQSSSVRWSDGGPQATVVGPAAKAESYEPVRVIGNEPLRQFLVAFPGGRLQALEGAYDPLSNQWFEVYGNEERKPGEWGHWTGRGMNWNYMCGSCHNTRLRRNYDERTDSYHTTMAEMSVGCEACHGPLKAHDEWQQRFGRSGQPDPTLTKLTRPQVLDNCGACHARRTDLTGDFRPGDNFVDRFDLALVDQSERYYPDGQVRDEDYEYGSLLGSRMHLRGVQCLDCHNPHSMKTLLPGNWLCLRCHNGSDTNVPAIDPLGHSHHKVYGSATNVDLMGYRPKDIQEKGGECVNCHMPQTVYMQRHWRHDHGFTSPDPILSKQFGIPNACNRCHQDRSADWALAYCEQWYGPKMERPSRRRAQVIVHAQRGEAAARDELVVLLKEEQSPYWRAVAVGLLGHWATRPEIASLLLSSLGHTNALVRTSAAAALEPALAASIPGVGQALDKALRDPVRSVRIAAASSLGNRLDPESAAGREFEQCLDNNADQPSGQMQKGIFCFLHGDYQAALAHFQKAAAWDPYSPPFRHQIAITLSALNRPEEARDALKEACRLNPRDAETHYKLGLAYNELGEVRSAAEELKSAASLEPRHALAWYNLGLAQNALGRPEEAIDSLLRAEELEPDDARSPYARATILARLGRTREARAAAHQALDREPSYSEAKQLLDQLSN